MGVNSETKRPPRGACCLRWHLSCLMFFLSSHISPSSAQSLAPGSSYPAQLHLPPLWDLQKQKWGKRKEQRQVSHICSDSIPEATLSSSPDSVVPGWDYPNSQLSALKLSCGVGGGVCLVSDKVEMGGWYGTVGDRKRRVWGVGYGVWLTFCHWVTEQECWAGWQTLKPPVSEARSQFIHTLRTGVRYITSSRLHHAAG